MFKERSPAQISRTPPVLATDCNLYFHNKYVTQTELERTEEREETLHSLGYIYLFSVQNAATSELTSDYKNMIGIKYSCTDLTHPRTRGCHKQHFSIK
jgi:hypothetical protein